MNLSEYIQALFDWTEKHAGLGGWLGAIGAIIAIFVTWGLARAEYNRNRRQRTARMDEEIVLIVSIISQFDDMVSSTQMLFAGKPEAPSFYNRHMNDPQFHAIRDLAGLPVTQ